MIKKLVIAFISLFVVCVIRCGYIIYEVNDWKQYVTKENSYDSLVYAYRAKDYNYLYEMVVVNEALNSESSDELYDFAHYYHELTIAHKNYLVSKDNSNNLKNMEYYLNRISTKDILISIEELNDIYKIEDQH